MTTTVLGTTQPDVEYIKARIPITAVARDLGLCVKGYKARCWRPENHRNGDSDPSVGFQKAKNRYRCFVCDAHSGSNIDLVMAVQGVEIRDALRWICGRYDVPSAPKDQRRLSIERWSPRFRVGVSGCELLDTVVRCGLWEDFGPSERAILPVLLVYADRSSGLATISYRGIMRYAGIGSPTTVSKALQRFENMHILRIVRGRDSGLRAVNSYCVTADDPQFQEIVTEIWRRQREQIELERQLRAEAREARAALLGSSRPLHLYR
jgi:hypothetical protein